MQSYEPLKVERDVREVKLGKHSAFACFEDGGRGLQSKDVVGF